MKESGSLCLGDPILLSWVLIEINSSVRILLKFVLDNAQSMECVGWRLFMEIIASYYTDVGRTKQINQDSLSVKVVNSPKGKLVFAVVCDGMGGLEQGELASKEVVMAMNSWFDTSFARMVASNTVSEELIFSQWRNEIDRVNVALEEYAQEQGVTLGTTLTALLTYQNQYFICHVGDSRICLLYTSPSPRD